MDRYYRLRNGYELRGYEDRPQVLCEMGNAAFCISLKDDDFKLLSGLDGVTPIDFDKLDLIKQIQLERFLKRGYVHGTELPNPIKAYQKFKFYPHKRKATAKWAITSRCNLSCLHCLNAVDGMSENATHETSLEEARIIIKRLADYGVEAVSFFGGEPTLHRHFKEIVREIHAAGMSLSYMNTNGMFIDEKMLDFFDELGCNPVFDISFDGLGTHDWMRNHKGCEEKVINAFKLCISRGFKVKMSMNVNRRTLPTLHDTIRYFIDMGCRELFFIRTSETLRWQEMSEKEGGLTITHNEFAEALVGIIDTFIDDLRAGVKFDFHYFLNLNKYSTGESITAPRKKCESECSAWCTQSDYGLYIGTMGHVLPCTGFEGNMYTSGRLTDDINIIKRDLSDIYQSECYTKLFDINAADVYDTSDKCKDCEHWGYCYGGVCRTSALYDSLIRKNNWDSWDRDDLCREDWSVCTINLGGYRKRIADILDAHPYEFEETKVS